MPFFTGFPDGYEKQLGDIYMDWPRLNLYFWNGTEWVAFVGRNTLRKECE